MARLLAVEWDSFEARLVLARTQRQGIVIERAVAVELPLTDDGEKLSPELVGEALRSAIAEHGLSSTTVLLGIRRADVELKQLTLPPAPDAELPELVRHQAARELGAVVDGNHLDFVPLDGEASQSRRVIAAAISGAQAEQIEKVVAAAGMSPQRWLLRSHATAALVHRQAPELQNGCMLVDILEHEVALTAVVDGQVVFLRSVRLSGDAERDDVLLAEIRRTLLAVQSQSLDGQIESICVLGCPDEHVGLIERLREELSLETRQLDPFDGLKQASALQADSPAHAGRFASLLGMLILEASNEPHAIDFLNPRRPPVPKNRRKMIAVGAAIVAVLVLFVAYDGWSQIHEVNTRIEEKREESKSLDKLVKRSQEKRRVAETIGNWTAGEIVWLDELRDLSLRFPSQRDAVILRLSMAGLPATRRTDDVQGAMNMDVLVRDSSLIDRMVTNLTDEGHKVDTGQVKRVKGSGDERANPWQFDATIFVGRAKKDQDASRLADTRKVDTSGRVDERQSSRQKIEGDESPVERPLPRDEASPPNAAPEQNTAASTDK